MDTTLLDLTKEALDENPRDVRQRALDAGLPEICIVVQYNDGLGTMRCLAEGRNIPAWMWKAVQWMDGYVERDTEDEGGAARYVVGPVDFEDARARYKEVRRG